MTSKIMHWYANCALTLCCRLLIVISEEICNGCGTWLVVVLVAALVDSSFDFETKG